MADEFDGCECFWSHEFAMRRLLTLIRSGQSYCTDTECVDLPTTTNVDLGQGGEGFVDFTMMTMFIVFAVILYLFRPNRLRGSSNAKPTRHHNNANDQGPGGSPPPTVG